MQNSSGTTASILILLGSLLAVATNAATNRIAAGETKSDSLAGAATDTYEYTSGGNEWVTISTAATGGGASFGPVFDLVATNGTVLAMGQTFLRSFRLTNAGVYQIVSRDSDAFDAGPYQVTLIRNPGPNQSDASENGTIVAGQTVSGNTGWADLDVRGYTSGGNEWVTISTAATSGGASFGPVFDLMAPDGTALATAQAYLQNFRLTNAGVYQIVSRDSDGFDAGAYQLTLIHNPGPNQADSGETNRIMAGQTASGTTGWADLDAYEFDAVAGDSLFVSLTTTAGGASFAPIFEIYGPDGSIVSTGTRRRVECLRHTGRFQIVCRDSDFFDAGSYLLRFLQTPGPPPTNAPPEYLQMFTCSNSVVVRWSTNATGFRLQSTEDLVLPPSAIIWTNLPPPYPLLEGFHFVTNTIPPKRKFFRLNSP